MYNIVVVHNVGKYKPETLERGFEHVAHIRARRQEARERERENTLQICNVGTTSIYSIEYHALSDAKLLDKLHWDNKKKVCSHASCLMLTVL